MPAAIPIVAAVVGGAMAANTAKKSAAAANAQQDKAIEAAKMDPALRAMLYGDGSSTLKPGVTATYDETGQQSNPSTDFETNSGLLGQVPGLVNRPQSEGLAGFGTGMDNFLRDNGMGAFGSSLGAAQGLQGSNFSTPTMQGASATAAQNGVNPTMQAASINAPGQNQTDLSSAYQDKIYGNPAENPYLTGAIQKGINQSTNAFQAMQDDATQNLTERVLPQIRSGAIMNGGFGGSRQGIAEGRAIGDFGKGITRAIGQFGQNNTDAAVGAQAGAFNQGQDRSLSALGSLSGNQYATAGQNAGFQQQAGSQNASQGLNNGQFNAGLLNQTGMANAGWQQQAGANNQNATMNTNALNSGNIGQGVSLSNGLLGNAYNYGQAQDNYDMTKLGQGTGLLGQFDKGGQPIAQPYYANTAGAAMGGAAAGLGLYNQFRGMGSSTPAAGSAQAWTNTQNGWNSGQGFGGY